MIKKYPQYKEEFTLRRARIGEVIKFDSEHKIINKNVLSVGINFERDCRVLKVRCSAGSPYDAYDTAFSEDEFRVVYKEQLEFAF